MSLKRNFLWLLAGRVISALFSFFIWALVNRALGPENRGIVGEIQTWLGLFVLAFSFGLDSAIYHFANREQYGADDGSRLITVLTLAGLYALLGSFLIFAFSLFWPGQFSALTLKYIFLLCLLFFEQILATHLITFIQALNRIKYIAALQIIQALLNVIIISSGYIFGKLDVFYVLINLIILQFAALLLAISYLLKSGLFKAGFKPRLAKNMIQAGIKQYIGNIAAYVYTRINQLIVLRYCGMYEAGLFSVSLNLTYSLLLVTSTLQAALYPRVIHGNDDYEVTIKSLRSGLYGWGLVVVLIIALAEPLLLLYGGEKFLAATHIFRLHMLSIWFLPLSSFIAPYYVKAGAFVQTSLAAVILSIISIGLNLVLVPSYGALGGALTTALSCLLGFAGSLCLFGYLTRKKVSLMFYPDFRSEFRFLKELFFKHKESGRP